MIIEQEGNWYVVFTKPRKEDMVYSFLQKNEIEIFFPKIKEKVNRQGKTISISVPLFPGYIFVKVVPELLIMNKIRWTAGVKKILGNGDIPVPIDYKIIMFMRNQSTDNGIIKLKNRFKPGDQVRVKSGVLKDLIGIIKEPTPREGRIKVLMNIIRHSAEVELEESILIKD